MSQPRRKKGPTPRRGKESERGSPHMPRVKVTKSVAQVKVPPVVSYRVYFNGELQQEVPHSGRGGRLEAVQQDVTPGVTHTAGVVSVSSYGITSDISTTEGSAPFDD